ncbi:speckle-type POZ protein [Nephila pilipes]|uniref:Speckle-type POZ protein n=1 Tax=Nephila pilipes TaxID=299642 RepID=A0A8X6TLQ8_NEPPI|nr:speckle-type POZ protein [Nephila pilipes]
MSSIFGKEPPHYSSSWKIDNFSACALRNGLQMCSPVFRNEAFDRTEWNLEFFPTSIVDEMYFSCYLRRAKDYGPELIYVGFRLAIVLSDGTTKFVFESENMEFHRSKSWGLDTFARRAEILNKKGKFYPNDTLTIRCSMWRRFPQQTPNRECKTSTRLKMEKLSFMWRIEDFTGSMFVKRYNIIHTTVDMTLFMLIMSVKDTEDENAPERVQISVEKRPNPNSAFIECEMSIVDCEGNCEFFQKVHHEFTTLGTAFFRFPPLVEKSVLLKDKRKYLPNDVLTIKCRVILTEGIQILPFEKSNRAAPLCYSRNKFPDRDSLIVITNHARKVLKYR